METIFELFNGLRIITIREDGEITLNIDKDSKIYDKISEELDKGVVDLKNFRNEGIPGKIKYNRSYENREDVSNLLTELKISFYSYSIETSQNEDELTPKIIDIYDARMKNIISNNRIIREFSDRYEYCLIKNYEDKYNDFIIDSIQFDDIFVQLLKTKEKSLIVSIDFSKEIFKIVNILDWINMYAIKILNHNEDKIENAQSIIEGLKFKSLPIILYRKGLDTIYVNKNKFREVTIDFIPNLYKVDTMNSKEVDSVVSKGEIILNGRLVDYIPGIRIDLTKDLLISNGHIIVASYLGDYSGCIGFFEEEGYDLPVAWIHDTYARVFIDVYEDEDSKIVCVEHSYVIDIDEF